jgi:hypothetical protein
METIHLNDRGRTLTFRLREMSAWALESWLLRAGALLIGPKGAGRDDPFAAAGILLSRGLKAFLPAGDESCLDLLDEMLEGCSLVADGAELPCDRPTLEARISDVLTLFSLRKAVLGLNLRPCRAGARKDFVLPREYAFRKALGTCTQAKPANVTSVVGTVIGQGMASMLDMQRSYSFGDALDMLELLNVRNYNQWAVREAAKHGR